MKFFAGTSKEDEGAEEARALYWVCDVVLVSEGCGAAACLCRLMTVRSIFARDIDNFF